MMLVSAITNRVPPAAAARRTAAAAAVPETGRAVIALQPINRDEATPPLSRRPRAAFLAHLIATAERLPQTREKRRAEPQVAAQAYVKVRDTRPLPAKSGVERTA